MLARFLARFPATVRRFGKAAGFAGFLGSLLGYTIFYTTFPNASVPSAGEANALFTVGPLFASAILVGILSDDLLSGILQAFVALPVGATVAGVLSLTPVFAGLVVSQPGDVVFFVLRSGFPLLFASIPINVVGMVLGVALQEKLRLGRS